MNKIMKNSIYRPLWPLFNLKFESESKKSMTNVMNRRRLATLVGNLGMVIYPTPLDSHLDMMML